MLVGGSLRGPGLARAHTASPPRPSLLVLRPVPGPRRRLCEDVHTPTAHAFCSPELGACGPARAARPLWALPREHIQTPTRRFPPKTVPPRSSCLTLTLQNPSRHLCLSSFSVSPSHPPPHRGDSEVKVHPVSNPPGSVQPAAMTHPCDLSLPLSCTPHSNTRNGFKLI